MTTSLKEGSSPLPELRDIKGGDFLDIEGWAWIPTVHLEEYQADLQDRQGVPLYKGDVVQREVHADWYPNKLINGKVRDNLQGFFGTHQGILEFVDRQGHLHVGFDTYQNKAALIRAGYTFTSNFPVELGPDSDVTFVMPVSTVTGRVVDSPRLQPQLDQLNQRYKNLIEKGRATRAAEEKVGLDQSETIDRLRARFDNLDQKRRETAEIQAAVDAALAPGEQQRQKVMKDADLAEPS